MFSKDIVITDKFITIAVEYVKEIFNNIAITETLV